MHFGCVASAGSAILGQKVDLRDYVIGGYDATSNETRTPIRQRVAWQKNGKRFGEEVPYLAIEAAIMPGEVIQPLWGNLANALNGSGFLYIILVHSGSAVGW